jgi:hypothetical protein
MTADEYQDLIDARDAEAAMRSVEAGTMPTIADADVDAFLAAPTPLAFWRKQRGLTQTELAAAVAISQHISTNSKTGSAMPWRRFMPNWRVVSACGWMICSRSNRGSACRDRTIETASRLATIDRVR